MLSLLKGLSHEHLNQKSFFKLALTRLIPQLGEPTGRRIPYTKSNEVTGFQLLSPL